MCARVKMRSGWDPNPCVGDPEARGIRRSQPHIRFPNMRDMYGKEEHP